MISCSVLWQQSDHPNHLVPPSRLQDFAKARRSVNTPAEKAAAAEKLHIKEGAPKRMKEEIVEGWGHLFCCECYPKNICRLHGPWRHRRGELDALSGMLNTWADGLRDSRDLAVELVSFQSMPVDESEPVVEVAALLVYAKRSPKMQMFADCALVQEGDQHLLRSFAPPALPFNITIMERPSRLAMGPGGHSTIAISASDALAVELLSLQPRWSMRTLECDLAEGSSLLGMVVRGRSEEFKIPAKVKKVRAPDLPDVFDLGDPYEYGRAQAPGPGQQPVAERVGGQVNDESGQAGVDDVAEDDLAWMGSASSSAEGEADGEEEAEEEEAIAEAAHEGMGDELGGAAVAPADEPPVDDFGDVAADQLVAAAGAVAGAEAADQVAVGGELAAPEGDPHRRAVEIAEISALMGYVTCTLAPWSSVVNVGRITQWPAHFPPARQNVGVRCYQHSGCSITRMRRRFTNEELLRWLFAMEPAPAASIREQRRALATSHKALADTMLPKA